MLKKKLIKNELTIGSWVMIGNSTSVEVMASAGFDWLAIDLETHMYRFGNYANFNSSNPSKKR